MKPALFLDRDGIVIKDTGYVSSTEGIGFVDGIFDLCRAAIARGYLVIVLTNQSGVARGYYTEAAVRQIHLWISAEFAKRNAPIDAFYFCPHHPDGTVAEYSIECNCRKPRPGLVLNATKDFDIDITRSIMIGDKESDRLDVEGLKCLILTSKYTSGGDIASLDEAATFL